MTVYEVVIGKVNIKEILLDTEISGLKLAPSHINLVGAEFEMRNIPDREMVLKKSLEEIKNDFDFIIIDCSPSLGIITINALTAADSVLIPVQCEYFALEGLGKLLNTIKLVQNRLNRSLQIEGFLLTMFDARLRHANLVVDEVRNHFNEMVFNTVIQRNVRLSEAPSFGKPVILHDAVSSGTNNYLNLAKEILKKNAQQ
jgi:chromosome partitioning protein